MSDLGPLWPSCYIFRLAALASEDVTISKPQISGCSMGARIQDVSVEFTLCFCR